MEYVGRDDKPRGCLFCAAGAGTSDEPDHVVEQAELTFTMLNRYPYSSGHLMVVPRHHAPDLVALTETEAAAVMSGARRAIVALTAALKPDGFNLGVNQGHVAGAGITDHVHLHVVPRWEGDTNFMPVLADVKVIPEHLDRTAEKLRDAMAAVGGERLV